MELNTIVSEVGTLVDIRDVSVNKELSRDERIAEFVQQIKNPYHFKCGRFTVQASFSAEGATQRMYQGYFTIGAILRKGLTFP